VLLEITEWDFPLPECGSCLPAVHKCPEYSSRTQETVPTLKLLKPKFPASSASTLVTMTLALE